MAKAEATRPRTAILNCPVCKTVRLAEGPLDEGLAAATCPQCAGHFVESGRYLAWVESRGERPPAAADASMPVAPRDPDPTPPVRDSGAGKFCAGCGRFLTRHKPGHGLEFHLDRCGGCGGIWLDAGEWEALRARGFHDQIHFICADRWQAEVARQDRVRQHEHLLAEKLGPDTLAEIKRVKGWLDAHPKKAELYAFLVGPRPDAPLPPSKR